MAPIPRSANTTPADSLRHDFEVADLNTPLKAAPIVSLRALEDGEDDFEDVDLSKRLSLWRRVLMIRKRHGRKSVPEHQPLRLLDTDEKIMEASVSRCWSREHGVRVCMAILILILCFFGIVHLTNVFQSLVPVIWDDDMHTFLPTWGKAGELGEGLASYPTDFTRDVTPMSCHSHNDYWRRVPLYEALHFGCTGVEADVWLFDNDLFVGHNTISLTRNRTFRSLYVDPLVNILDHQNPVTEFGKASRNGVFDKDPSQTLVLLVDFKNSGEDIYPVVVQQLSALREKGYLTCYDGKTILPGPITVVATGNAPFNLLTTNSTYRDIFFDAPLSELYEEPESSFSVSSSYPKTASKFTLTAGPHSPPQARSSGVRRRLNSGQGTVGTNKSSIFDITNSYYASVSFKKAIGIVWGGRLSHKQMKLIRGQIQGAKRRGLKARYWGTPKWPVGLRNHVWDVLSQEGIDYINGDDLRAMTREDWRRRRHHGWL
ncbi:hypothetical protein K469DRAFT_699781 [Zopfia rhizophila CBS 207.26]|uniref:Altered inheritance of mitochondria protein 6 n=1 Tax=Zopfia rhizophila CBS 207.26 TaxID=1314779 RepID=A0A6A6EJU1_9PEZI|nr:hypothetical protein K469DRAFT_699781 [Zopfia rhizophila CBS 207.26]